MSSTYIWHTKRSPLQVFVNRVGPAFPTLKALAIIKSLRHSYHALGGLLKSIECLRELVDVVGIPVVLKAMGLFHVYLLLDWSIEESTLHVHLEQLKIMVGSIG
jgi:hypothetical protein